MRRPNLESAVLLCAATAGSVAAFVVYAASNPGVVELIDSGELMTALMCGGIIHPTGYPLFSLLGYAIAPLARSHAAEVLPWLSHIPAAAAIGGVFWITGHWARRGRLPLRWALLCALTTATAMATARTLWLTAAETEVYALTFLLVVIELGIALAAQNAASHGRSFTRLLLLWFFLFGLASGNHASVLALAPAGLWLGWMHLRSGERGALRTLTLAGLFALLGLSILLQLPLRAASLPLLNWGSPNNWERFIQHIRGAQYGVWFFSRPPGTWPAAAGKLLRIIFVEDLPLLPPIAALALLLSIRRRRRPPWRAVALLLAVAAVGFALAWSYDIPDIRTYLLPAEAALVLLGGASLAWIYRHAPRWRWPVTLGALMILQLSVDHSATYAARGDYRVVDDYARTLLAGLEPNAVLLTDRWDTYSAAIFLHFVEGLRPDVVLIDKELLRRSWYYAYLEQQAPDLYSAIESHAKEFLRALEPFEAGQPYDSAALQHHYVALCRGILRGGPEKRPAYALLDQPEGILNGFRALPGIVAWRVYPPGQDLPAGLPAYPSELLDPPRTPPSGSACHDPRAMRLAREHGNFALARARFWEQMHNRKAMLEELQRACRLLPDNIQCKRWLASTYKEMGEQQKAAALEEQAKLLERR